MEPDGSTEARSEAHIILLGFAGHGVRWSMVDAVVVPQAPLIDRHVVIVAPTAATRFRRAVNLLGECRRRKADRDNNQGKRAAF